MPKEMVYGYADPSHMPGFGVEVAWMRDQQVQVASVDLGAEPATVERGWYTTLDRSSINHLIRTLRKARDQAYGADE